ncbi:hypothetical protein I4I73_05500 [Pseudonocardia sp. KRD-184]|uniref:Mutator family transposase n=1 Tax=Pseudonocardia oceani TaxID=2792013 RepID=A0ABS6UJQ0_9PSEU|nr:hypothetical protein [Pseudonocardia oceani]MBW0088607.1 hypothetical protein [Pseudonocardia oceani]MBW0095450.1 hypothetical protein [Pseudonocardia oceani]MBW0109047.1 hypothetical protein [Pseudonocardia oceani]MBW0120028.1 hypothetical protein [Pseudonocardia oceani]MBW0132484.1 hypothetical protein [Pseudonocardia oceani]
MFTVTRGIDQMLAHGVTREWTTLLRPWLPVTDIDVNGRLLGAARSASAAAAFLEIIPFLDRDHRIHREHDGQGNGHQLVGTCSGSGRNMPR